MPFLDRPQGVKVYYEVHGEGVPLLLTHGFSSTSAMWNGQIAPFSAKYKLIIWDMRGHGQTSYPEGQSLYSEDHTVADMHALLDHVVPSTKAIVGGLSLGGHMSLAFYRRFPERVAKLLIIDTGPGFKKDSAREAWNKIAYASAEKFERDGLERLEKGSKEVRVVKHRDATGLARAARGMLSQRNDSVITSLERIAVPSLIVVGSEDKPYLAASNYMTAKIPEAKLVVIQNAGHAANIDQPDAFNKAILGFLDQLAGGKAKI